MAIVDIGGGWIHKGGPDQLMGALRAGLLNIDLIVESKIKPL